MRMLIAAAGSWVVMIVVGLGLGLYVESHRHQLDSDTFGMYLFVYPLAMAVPFAFVALAVYWPVAAALRRRFQSRLVLGALCAAASPLAGASLFVLGTLRWGPPRLELSHIVPMALALAAGGLTFGLISARESSAQQDSTLRPSPAA